MAEPEKEAKITANESQTVEPTDKLKFRYIAAYLVEGLQGPTNGLLSLYSDAAQGKKVYLTGHSHEGLHHIDTVHTIAYIILTSLFHGKTWDLNEFASHVSTTTQDRVRRYGPNAAFLVVEASHEEEAASIGRIEQSEDRDFCLALPNGFRDAVETRHKIFLDQSQAFLSFAMPSVSGFEAVGSCIVADHPSGKPLYVLTASATARPTLSSPIPADGPERFATLFQHSAELEHFKTAFQLSAGSASNARDNLRAFLFAFTALDSFLCRFFKKYKQRLLRHRKDNLAPTIQTYVEGIEQRREDQGRTGDDYPLAYKFALIASYLDFNNLDQIVDEFDDVTEHRIAIAHGYDFNEAALPTAKARNWLGELVRLHMARKDPPA